MFLEWNIFPPLKRRNSCHLWDDVGEHHAKWNKPITEGQIVHNSTYIKYLKWSNSKDHEKNVFGEQDQKKIWSLLWRQGIGQKMTENKNCPKLEEKNGISLVRLRCSGRVLCPDNFLKRVYTAWCKALDSSRVELWEREIHRRAGIIINSNKNPHSRRITSKGMMYERKSKPMIWFPNMRIFPLVAVVEERDNNTYGSFGK